MRARAIGVAAAAAVLLFGVGIPRCIAEGEAPPVQSATPAAEAAPAPAPPQQASGPAVAAAPEMTLDAFLDRLMISESGGRLQARNPLSTAVGPFQFIASTWLQIAHASFAEEISELKPNEVLDLRSDLKFARRAAKIYTEANAAYLVANDLPATFANLRLAHLVGPGGAVHVLSAKPETPVATLLGSTVIGANPFMRSMTAEDLIARAARDIAIDARIEVPAGAATPAAASPTEVAAAAPEASAQPAGLAPSPEAVAAAKAAAKDAAKAAAKKAKAKPEPRIEVECDLARPSCRRWLALAKINAKRSRRASRE